MAKQTVRWRSGRMQIGAVFVAALALFLVGDRGMAAVAQPDSDMEDLGAGGQHENPALFPPQSHPYGSGMDTWAENWWRWLMAIPAAQNPFLSEAADCNVNQGGPVFYIPPFALGSQNHTRSCTIEHGKALAFSLSTVLNDYPCPDPTFQPAPGQSLFDFLLAGAVAGNADIAEIDVTIDGKPQTDLLAYHFASNDLMFFKGDPSLQSSLDACVTGGFQPAAVDAFLIIVKPLPPGHHTITRRVVTTTGRITGPNTTEIEVVPQGTH